MEIEVNEEATLKIHAVIRLTFSCFLQAGGADPPRFRALRGLAYIINGRFPRGGASSGEEAGEALTAYSGLPAWVLPSDEVAGLLV